MDRYGFICRNILEHPNITQRELAKRLDISLGTANRLINDCLEQGLAVIDSEANKYTLTEKGMALLLPYKVDGAVSYTHLTLPTIA